MLHQAVYPVRRAFWPTLPNAGLGKAAQVARRGLSGRDQLLGILVAQLVEGEAAPLHDPQGFFQQLGRIEADKRPAGPQMAFAVGMEP